MKAIDSDLIAKLERTAEAMFAEPQWWRAGRDLPTMMDGKALFDANCTAS